MKVREKKNCVYVSLLRVLFLVQVRVINQRGVNEKNDHEALSLSVQNVARVEVAAHFLFLCERISITNVLA